MEKNSKPRITATLDETVKKTLNKLVANPKNKNWRRKLEIFDHYLTGYGVDAVAHFHIMNVALNDILSGKLSIEQFCKKYKIKDYSKILGWGGLMLAMPLKSVEQDGIFIPSLAYHKGHYTFTRRSNERITWFFELDYRNVFDDYELLHKTGSCIRPEYKYAYELTGNPFELDKLKDSEFIEQGIQFSKDLWRICVKSFEKYKNRQPKKITELGRKLIKYYSAIVLGENSD